MYIVQKRICVNKNLFDLLRLLEILTFFVFVFLCPSYNSIYSKYGSGAICGGCFE